MNVAEDGTVSMKYLRPDPSPRYCGRCYRVLPFQIGPFTDYDRREHEHVEQCVRALAEALLAHEGHG
jgi:hypothetical protein